MLLEPGQRRRITVQIVGTGGPGTGCGPHREIEVSVQVGESWEGAVPGDVATFRHAVQIEAVGHPEGPRWRGAAVHGPTRERFLYLVWTGRMNGGPREMFRRAKLKLDTIPTDVLDRALSSGVVMASLALAMPDGTPVCATPRSLVWTS